MLHSASELTGHAIEAADGRIGSVKDVYFDDEHRTVRYLVADTGTWLPGRRVLLPPHAVERVDGWTRATGGPAGMSGCRRRRWPASTGTGARCRSGWPAARSSRVPK